MKRRVMTAVAMGGLWCAVLAAAVATVDVRHSARRHFVELQALEAQRDALDIEWGQLRIEQSTWATHGRIEELARERLDMAVPSAAKVRILRWP